MAFIPCFSRRNHRLRDSLGEDSTLEKKRVIADCIKAVHVVHCHINQRDPGNLIGLPREWESVRKVLEDETASERKQRAALKKIKKFPEPTFGKEMIIFKGGAKIPLADKECIRTLETFSKPGQPGDDYDILFVVGEGHFGTVYEVQRKDTLNTFALKQCSPRTAKSAYHYYLTEIVALSFLTHPNIIKTFDSYFATPLEAEKDPSLRNVKVPFLVMELMELSLSELLQRVYQEYRLEEDVVAFIMREILAGVAYLHKKGIFHRDLKSDNILLAFDGSVKVADFGLSVRFACPEEQFEGMIGTCLWMAPEVCRLDKDWVESGEAKRLVEQKYTYKADIWSLGIVLIELLDGEPPHIELWNRDEKFQIRMSIVEKPPTRPKREVSPAMDLVLSAMLRKNPDRRLDCEQILEEEIFKFAASRDDFIQLLSDVFGISD